MRAAIAEPNYYAGMIEQVVDCVEPALIVVAEDVVEQPASVAAIHQQVHRDFLGRNPPSPRLGPDAGFGRRFVIRRIGKWKNPLPVARGHCQWVAVVRGFGGQRLAEGRIAK
jgi:hypothetical protein